MKYVYHMCPTNMAGEVLYPLNQLKETLPEVFAENLKRYEGRESLMQEKIGPLDCLWNDVLHFAPVDLRKVYTALREAGQTPRPGLKYFRIPVERLSQAEIVWYKYTGAEKGDFKMPDTEFVKITASDYQELSDLPQATKDYFAEVTREGSKRTFLFHLCPHVLVKGPVNVSGCEVFQWNDV